MCSLYCLGIACRCQGSSSYVRTASDSAVLVLSRDTVDYTIFITRLSQIASVAL